MLDKSKIPYDALSEEVQMYLDSEIEPSLAEGTYYRDR